MLRYFGPTVTFGRPFALRSAWIEPTADVEQAVQELRQARDRIERALPKAAQLYRDFAKADGYLYDALQAAAFLKVGLKIDPKDFQLPEATPAAAELVRAKAEEAQKSIAARLDPFEEVVRKRVRLAISLLAVPEVAAKVDGGAEAAGAIGPLTQALAAIGDASGAVLDLRNDKVVFEALMRNVEAHRENERLLAEIRRMQKRVRDDLKALREQLSQVEYPFEHARAGISVAHYAIEQVPPMDDVGETYGLADTAIDNLRTLYSRLMGQIAFTADKLEAALGLSPLTLPPPPEEKPGNNQ
jgi:hypothetical protein